MDDNRMTNVGAVNRFGFRGYLMPKQMSHSTQNDNADLTQAATVFIDDRKTLWEKSGLKKNQENAQVGRCLDGTDITITDRKCAKKLHKRSRNASSDSQQVTGFSSDEEDGEIINSRRDTLTSLSSENEEQTCSVEDCNENVLGCGEDMAFDELAGNVSFRDVLLSLEDTTFAPLAVLSVPEKSSKIEDESFPEILSEKNSIRLIETDSSID